MAMAAFTLPRVVAPPYSSSPRLPHHRHALAGLRSPNLNTDHARYLLGFGLQRSLSNRCGQRLGQPVAPKASLVQPSSSFPSSVFEETLKTLKFVVTVAVLVSALQRRKAGFLFLGLREDEAKALTDLKGGLLHASLPLCFAALSWSPAVSTPLTVVAAGMAKWLELYCGVLMIRVLLSWFPNIPWERQPLQAIRDMCDPYLNLFRNLIPPIFNALDVSPILAFLVLGYLVSVLNSAMR